MNWDEHFGTLRDKDYLDVCCMKVLFKYKNRWLEEQEREK